MLYYRLKLIIKLEIALFFKPQPLVKLLFRLYSPYRHNVIELLYEVHAGFCGQQQHSDR